MMGHWLDGFDQGYTRGREEAAQAVRDIAADWPAHHTDYVVKTALARAAIAAEGKHHAKPVPQT
jgi:hypothetical protein